MLEASPNLQAKTILEELQKRYPAEYPSAMLRTLHRRVRKWNNDLKQISTPEDATKACAFRWKIEQYHREAKQTTGIGKCQDRNAKSQRKHIITSILAWIVLTVKAHAKNTTIYALKNEPLKEFQALIWRQPYTAFST